MTHDDPDRLTPEQKRARNAVRELREPSAGAAFRTRLRATFVSGQIAGRRPLRPTGQAQLRWGAALAAAIAAVLVVGFMAMNRGPGWRILESRGEGNVLVDGQSVSLRDQAELARVLRPGVRLQLPQGGELDLVCKGRMVLQLTPGTEMTLPGSPGRWLGRQVQARFESGEARILSGPAFRGATLVIRTREALTTVRGTTLAVIRKEASTCVCVFEGTVEVGDVGHAAENVPTGKRKFVYADGRPPAVVDIDAMETSKLAMFQDRSRSALSGVRP